MELAPAVRVNAVAPGFFVSEQSRRLQRGELTVRAPDHPPHVRGAVFCEADELIAMVIWLSGRGASFFTGASSRSTLA